MQRIFKISSKGQITLPKPIRDKLGSNLVRIVAGDDGVRIEPVRDLGGSLKAYAKSYVPIEEAREEAARASLDHDDRRY
jgi:AbrB family looped-hinge helix DNA binding protein